MVLQCGMNSRGLATKVSVQGANNNAGMGWTCTVPTHEMSTIDGNDATFRGCRKGKNFVVRPSLLRLPGFKNR